MLGLLDCLPGAIGLSRAKVYPVFPLRICLLRSSTCEYEIQAGQVNPTHQTLATSDLSYNTLSGAVPEISKFTSLETLYVTVSRWFEIK